QGQHVRRIEAGIDGQQKLEAADHETGADQEHQGESHLRDHQRIADVVAMALGRRLDPSLFQRPEEVGGRKLESRHQAEDRARQDRDPEGESEDPGVDGERIHARNVARTELDHQREAPESQQQSQTSAADPQQNAFGEHLADEPAAARTIAARTAISRTRSAARASRRLATLAQATRRTQLTAPSRMYRVFRKLPTTWSLSGMTDTVEDSPIGNCSWMWRKTVFMLEVACGTVTPGLSRATVSSVKAPRSERLLG